MTAIQEGQAEALIEARAALLEAARSHKAAANFHRKKLRELTRVRESFELVLASYGIKFIDTAQEAQSNDTRSEIPGRVH